MDYKELPSFKPKLEDSKKAQVNKPFKKWYIGFATIYGILILSALGILLSNISVLWKFIFIIFAVPFTLLNTILILIRLYLDRTRIKNRVVTTMSNNYILAKFFKRDRKTKQEAFFINTEGNYFIYDGGIYIIDLECVWFDEDKNPTMYYIEGIPNPLTFDFAKNMDIYLEELKSKVNDDSGKPLKVDIGYNARNLKKFKADKFLEEMHRNPSTEKMIYALMVLIGIIVIAFVVIFFIRGGN